MRVFQIFASLGIQYAVFSNVVRIADQNACSGTIPYKSLKINSKVSKIAVDTFSCNLNCYSCSMQMKSDESKHEYKYKLM